MPETVLGFNLGLIQHMLFQFFNTAVLFAILTLILNKPVRKFLQARTDRIANQISSAQRQLQEAEDLKKQYEDKIAQVNVEKDEILESARQRAKINEDAIVSAARKEAEQLKARAELEIQREQVKLKDDFKKQLIEVSTLMASQYITAKMDTDTQSKILENVISDLGDVKWLS